MQKLVLDYSTWRCGEDGTYALGKGQTKLLNNEGFMCCLGQISLQLNPALTKNEILNIATPGGTSTNIPLLSTKAPHANNVWENSDITYLAMLINDDTDTTPQEKIELLKELFKPYCTIKVINQP